MARVLHRRSAECWKDDAVKQRVSDRRDTSFHPL
jgi:hypothetical protein